MFRLQPIDTLDLPELAPYRTLRRPQEHQAQGIFVAEGEKVVRRLLESSYRIVSILLPEKWIAGIEPLLRARAEDFPVFVVNNKQLLEGLVGFSMFQGVMAVGRIPRTVTLCDVIANNPGPRLFVAVDALANAENLGVLVRNCAAFRAQALLVGETCASPFLRRAVRNSMGAVFQLPVVEPRNLADALGRLRAAAIRCVAAHPRAEQRTLSRANLRGDCCFVFGSEGHGLSTNVLAACDEAVAIPMPAGVDSLNVASAAAVFLYEAARQRGQL